MKSLGIKAVILAGGLGTRLRPYTLFMPKPMLPLGDKPVLEHIIEWLKHNGVSDIIISVGYLRRIIEDYFQNGSDLGVNISYVRTKRPMGTAGQLKAAENIVDGTFICLYGDTIVDFDLRKATEAHIARNATATMTLMHHTTMLKYGFIETDGNDKVIEWNEKPEFKGLINIGCYIMEPKFLDHIPTNRMYGMDVAFKEVIKAGAPIYSVTVDGDFVDIGDRKSYQTAYDKYLSKLGDIL